MWRGWDFVMATSSKHSNCVWEVSHLILHWPGCEIRKRLLGLGVMACQLRKAWQFKIGSSLFLHPTLLKVFDTSSQYARPWKDARAFSVFWTYVYSRPTTGRTQWTLWFRHLSRRKTESFRNCVWKVCKDNELYRRLALRNTRTFSMSSPNIMDFCERTWKRYADAANAILTNYLVTKCQWLIVTWWKVTKPVGICS